MTVDQYGPTWGLRLIASLPMQGHAYDLLTEEELKSVKLHSAKAASAYEIALGNYCVQKTRADSADKEIERLTTENRRLKNKCNSLWKAINKSTPEHYPSKDDLKLEVIE